MASVPLVDVGSAKHCDDGHDRMRNLLWPCSFSRRGPCHLMWWRARQVSALLCLPFAFWAWAQTATVVADTTVKGSALASVCLVCVYPPSHWGGGQDR